MENKRIGLELRSLNNLIRRYFEASSHKKEIEKITGNNGWIIGYLAKNMDKDIYQKDIEEQFTITRSTASRVLTLMEQKGLIVRKSVIQDARLKKLVLTEKALQLDQTMKEVADQMERALIKGFRPEEIEQLESYLMRMKENMTLLHASSKED